MYISWDIDIERLVDAILVKYNMQNAIIKSAIF